VCRIVSAANQRLHVARQKHLGAEAQQTPRRSCVRTFQDCAARSPDDEMSIDSDDVRKLHSSKASPGTHLNLHSLSAQSTRQIPSHAA
jgi:DNA-nicking Smr family endonuclease